MATITYTLGDKEYILSPLCHEDWQSLLKYYQYRDYEQLKRDAQIYPELKEELPNVLRACAHKKASINDIQSNVFDMGVITQIVYLSVRHRHPAITLEDLGNVIDMESSVEVLERIMDISLPENKPVKGQQTAAKKKK